MTTFGLFLIFLSASVAAASTGILFKPGSWYEQLEKPAWTPLKWMFPVVWTFLYITSAYAAARVAALPEAGPGLAFWSLQIALNTLWTPVFFGAHRVRAGMVVISCLWLSLAGLLVQFLSLDLIAGLLIVPYLAWVSVASALNFWILRNNPAQA